MKISIAATPEVINDFTDVLEIDKGNFAKMFPVVSQVDAPIVNVSTLYDGFPYHVNMYIYYRNQVIIEGGLKS